MASTGKGGARLEKKVLQSSSTRPSNDEQLEEGRGKYSLRIRKKSRLSLFT